jgi:hypothetical protein
LSNFEIEEIYGDSCVYLPLKWPNQKVKMVNNKGAHWVLLDHAEVCLIPLICGITSLIIDGTIKNKTYLEFAFDLYEIYSEYSQKQWNLHT